MMPEKSSADLHETAAAWVARIDRGPLPPDEQRHLDSWLAEQPRNMGAFIRAQAAWHLTARSEIAGAAITAGKAQPPNRRRLLAWGTGAVAASLAAAVWGVRHLIPVRFATDLGEVAQKSLSDGSVVALDTASIITEKFTPAERAVLLDQGQAFFDVAKDPARPFVVSAGAIRVKAVGTAFVVRRNSAGAEITVTEGTISVWNVASRAEAFRLSAGHATRMNDDAVAPTETRPVTPDQVNQKVAWRTGQIILSGETLAFAAAEFNRYNTLKIEIADPALARKTLVGGFRTSDPRGFASVVASLLHARIDESGNAIVLTR